MECELMREPWTFSREPTSCVVVAASEPRISQQADTAEAAAAGGAALDEEPASTDLSAWEENFQDLSGWCMANIQPRCNLPTGESAMAAKLTGTRIEGSDVLTAANGATRGFIQAIGKKTFGGVDAIVDAHRLQPATCVVSPQQDQAYPMVAGHQQQQQEQQQMYFNNNNNNNSNNVNYNNNAISGKSIIGSEEDNNVLKSSGNVWMGLTGKTEPAVVLDNNNTVNWQEFGDLGIINAATGLPVYQQPAIDLDVKPLLPQVQRQDSQDVFRRFENEASNGFDLLSYLCEGEVPSPGDSVSTDSSRITDVNSLPRLPSNSSAHIVVSPKTYELISLSASSSPAVAQEPLKSLLQQASADSACSGDGSPKHSPISASSSETVIAQQQRSAYARQLRSIVKLEKPESPEPSLERRSSRPRRTRTISSTSRNSSTSSSTRGRGRKRMLLQEDSEDYGSDDENYRETREKNNEASRKSRMNKKAKEVEMSKRALELEKDNRILKMKVEELEKLVSSMRNALLRSALKREVKPNVY